MDIINVIDTVIAVWLIGGIIIGYCTGLILKVAQFVAIIISYVGAYIIAKVLSGSIDIGLASHIAYAVLFIISFIIINTVLRHIIKILKIVDHIPVISTINNIGGAFAGFIVDFVIIFIICNVVFGFIPQEMLDACGLTKHTVDNSMLLSIFVP